MRTRVPVLVLLVALVLATSVAANGQAKIVDQPQVLKQNGEGWTFVFRYPKLSVPGALMGTNAMMNDYNRAMQTLAQNELARFKKDVAGWEVSPEAPPGNSEVDATYKILTRNGIISVKFDEYVYMRGAAHPTTEVITRNWLGGGGFVQIGDLFRPGTRWLNALSKGAERGLKSQKEMAPYLFPEGYGPKAENFAAFGITKQGLVLYFQRGQVAAGAAGNPSATIQWSALKSMLKPTVWQQIARL